MPIRAIGVLSVERLLRPILSSKAVKLRDRLVCLVFYAGLAGRNAGSNQRYPDPLIPSWVLHDSEYDLGLRFARALDHARNLLHLTDGQVATAPYVKQDALRPLDRRGKQRIGQCGFHGVR